MLLLQVYHQEGTSLNEASPQLEDLALIKRVLAGDRDRFRDLVEIYQNTIFALVMRQVGKRDVAEDLTQEVFVKAYKALSKFRSEAKFSTWLTRIALNHTNTYFCSKRYREQQRTQSFDPALHDSAAHDRSEHSEEEKRLELFREALAKLKPHLREVLVMCGLEGKSYQETAEILEIPIGTVRSRLNTARLKLKDALGSL